VAGEAPGGSLPSRALVAAVAFAVTAVWVTAGLSAVYTHDVQPFLIASGPFTILCGYLFGVAIVRAPR